MKSTAIFGGMILERYIFKKIAELYYYEFYSTGPKGLIRKLVCFNRTRTHPYSVFNLGFGDGKEVGLEIDDIVITNNQDTRKVLQTVAMIAIEFLRLHSDAWIKIEGNTPARNRLYQMWITKFWDDIDQYFSIMGVVDDQSEPFMKGQDYDAIIFIKKTRYI